MGLLAFVFLVVLGFWLIPPSATPDLPSQGYLDIHVHVAGVGFGGSGAFINEEMRSSWKYPIYLDAFGVEQEEIEAHGDQLIIERLAGQIRESLFVDQAVVLAMDGIVDEQGELDREKTQIYVPNEYLIAELPKYRELLFGASINPYRPDAIERLDYVVQNDAKLIKWLPNIMEIDPADERVIPFYLRMAEHGIPLLTHAGKESSFVHANDDLGDPQKLRLPLSLGVTVIAAHIASTGKTEGEEHFDRIFPLFEEFPNLFADISSLTQINKRNYLERALAIPGALDRLIYGSDWPLQFFPVVSPYFHLDQISIADVEAVQKHSNTWDHDVVLKKKMGVPEEVFLRSREVLD